MADRIREEELAIYRLLELHKLISIRCLVFVEKYVLFFSSLRPILIIFFQLLIDHN